MAQQTALADVNHVWGGDIQLGPSGDIGMVTAFDRSKQRVLRRLLTNPKEYIWHPIYGAGAPQQVGRNIDLKRIQGLIIGQMLLEASVARNPAPIVDVREIPQGVQAQVQYVSLPDKQPVSIQFSVDF